MAGIVLDDQIYEIVDDLIDDLIDDLTVDDEIHEAEELEIKMELWIINYRF